jgi:predicted porin
MKKTLIALAAVAATGAAFAQSSVTLYGVADASLAKVTGKSAYLSSAGTMNNGTSRWGVRGTEDLGGGLKAGFNFEQGLSLNDGSLSKAGAGEFGRAAWMNLSGGFGELRLGRTLNPSFYAAAAWELTGAANYRRGEPVRRRAGRRPQLQPDRLHHPQHGRFQRHRGLRSQGQQRRREGQG